MISQTDIVFDIDQLRNVCMEDSDLMRELVTALIDDATEQMSALRDARSTPTPPGAHAWPITSKALAPT